MDYWNSGIMEWWTKKIFCSCFHYWSCCIYSVVFPPSYTFLYFTYTVVHTTVSFMNLPLAFSIDVHVEEYVADLWYATCTAGFPALAW